MALALTVALLSALVGPVCSLRRGPPIGLGGLRASCHNLEIASSAELFESSIFIFQASAKGNFYEDRSSLSKRTARRLRVWSGRKRRPTHWSEFCWSEIWGSETNKTVGSESRSAQNSKPLRSSVLLTTPKTPSKSGSLPSPARGIPCRLGVVKGGRVRLLGSKRVSCKHICVNRSVGSSDVFTLFSRENRGAKRFPPLTTAVSLPYSSHP